MCASTVKAGRIQDFTKTGNNSVRANEPNLDWGGGYGKNILDTVKWYSWHVAVKGRIHKLCRAALKTVSEKKGIPKKGGEAGKSPSGSAPVNIPSAHGL